MTTSKTMMWVCHAPRHFKLEFTEARPLAARVTTEVTLRSDCMLDLALAANFWWQARIARAASDAAVLIHCSIAAQSLLNPCSIAISARQRLAANDLTTKLRGHT